MFKKKLLTFGALAFSVAFLFGARITSNAAEKDCGDITVYYSRSTISARVNTDTVNVNQEHYNYVINSVTVEDADGDQYLASPESLQYNTIETADGVVKEPVEADGLRHNIATLGTTNVLYSTTFNDASLNGAESSIPVSIVDVDITFTKAPCVYPEKRTKCTQGRCIYCGHTWETEAVHNWKTVIDKKPTCTEDGYQHDQCTVCGEKRNENTVIDKLGHDWQPATKQKNRGCLVEPTYQNNGVYRKWCSRCNGYDDAEFDYVDGTRKVCRHEMYPDRADNYYEWVVIKEATKTEDGLRAKQCRICGDIKEETVIKKGHSSGVKDGKLVTYENKTETEPEEVIEETKIEPEEVDEELTKNNVNAPVIRPAEVKAQKKAETKVSLLPTWGIIVIVIVVLIAIVLIAHEYFLRDWLKDRKESDYDD